MPLLATAIHAGHAMRAELAERSALTPEERLREEDPFTDRWVSVSDTTIVGTTSRFEADLNRSPDLAIYRGPEDAWGLKLWERDPDEEAHGRSRERYAATYAAFGDLLDAMLDAHERVVIYDIHSYNHQRKGPGVFADTETDPDINLGTANLDRAVWGGVVEELMHGLRRPMADGRRLQVAENVKFKGGWFTRWAFERYGDRVCPIAIEFKKIFMDEWTGVPDEACITGLHTLLKATVPSVIDRCHDISAP